MADHTWTTPRANGAIDLTTGTEGSAEYVTEPLEADKSLGELFSALTSDLSDLMHAEVELAKVEIKEEVRGVGKGAGLVGAGAFCAYLGVLLVSFAVVYGLAAFLPTGVAFLIVGVLYGVAAFILGSMGKQEIANVDPVPQQTVETLQEDVRWAKQQLS